MLARGLWVSLQFYIQLQNFVFLVLVFNTNTLFASFSLVGLKIERELIICIALFSIFRDWNIKFREIGTKLKNLRRKTQLQQKVNIQYNLSSFLTEQE